MFFFSALSGLKSSFRVYPPSPLFFPSKIRNSTSDKKANMSRQLSMRHLSLLTSVTCKQSQRSFLPSSLSLSYCSLIQEKKKSRFSPRGPPTSCIYTYSLYIYIYLTRWWKLSRGNNIFFFSGPFYLNALSFLSLSICFSFLLILRQF